MFGLILKVSASAPHADEPVLSQGLHIRCLRLGP
jgi:hypothetical protein